MIMFVTFYNDVLAQNIAAIWKQTMPRMSHMAIKAADVAILDHHKDDLQKRT